MLSIFMATIRFNLEPPFTVDLTPPRPAAPTLSNIAARVGKAVTFPLYSLAILFQSLVYAAASTCKSIPQLYKNGCVQTNTLIDNLRNRNPILYLYPKVLVAFGFTLLDCALLFAVDTARRVYEKLFPQSSMPLSEIALTHLKQNKLHPEHMQVIDTTADVSQVPNTVQLSELLNFYDDNTLLQEGYIEPLAEERKDLDTLITRIQNRAPFLGTPPSYDIPQLERFYKGIEDNLRFCIHKVKTDLENFQKLAGRDPSKYTEEQKNQYKNCKEEIHRLAVDIAHAGTRCGAAYCAEALDAYSRLSGKKTKDTMNLQEYLQSLCADKRKKIAQKHIGNIGTDAHTYTHYMQALGKILALPNSQNVVEHLTSLENPLQHIEDFFKEYTDQEIIRAVQAEIKESPTLRERILDWIKDQHEPWNWEPAERRIGALLEEILNLKNVDDKEDWIKAANETCVKFDVYIEEENFQQVCEKQITLEELIRKAVAEGHALEFILKTKLDRPTLQKNGLPKEYMEWLLVSNNILQPQISGAQA